MSVEVKKLEVVTPPWGRETTLRPQNLQTIVQHLVGIGHDWSKPFFTGASENHPDTMKGEEHVDYLWDQFYRPESHTNKLSIPTKKNGDPYRLQYLNSEQQDIVICAMEAVIKFLTNDPTYKLLRATIMSCGGTGKSFIINTLIATIRN